LDLIREHSPDVAVLDIQMPEMTGIEVTRAVRAENLPVGILILSAYDDDPYVIAVLQAGANGYVLKNASADDIVRAVHSVHEGQSALDPIIARKMIDHVTGAANLHTPPTITPLSPREIDVLQLAARGYTNKAIAAQLNISDRTVQGHLASIYAKLGINTRTEAVMIGVRNGWVTVA
jgi:DNA-binding NarL/FixJ family response regulator